MISQPDPNPNPNTKVLHDLCSLIIHTLNFPLPKPFPSLTSSPSSSSTSSSSSSSSSFSSSHHVPIVHSMAQVSPAAFASLFIGISLSLMLFGSVVLLVGLILMPWILLFVLLFYLAAFAYSLSEFGHSILCCSSPCRNHMPRKAWEVS